MPKYILKRILIAIPTLLGITILLGQALLMDRRRMTPALAPR